MPRRHKRTLAIDPGTREMGVALFEEKRIIYHAVKVIPKKKSPHDKLKEGRRIILGLIKDFKPRIVAVEKTFFGRNRNAALLNVFFDEIKAIARRKGLEVLAYAPNTVRKFVCGNGWATKKEVAAFVISKYPELKIYLTQDRAWKEKYHQNMFDAVAVGMMALRCRV